MGAGLLGRLIPLALVVWFVIFSIFAINKLNKIIKLLEKK